MNEKDEFIFGLKGKKKGGRLKGWVADIATTKEAEYIMGKVYDSPAEMFEEGDIIKCSRTVKVHEKDDAPYILETMHSYYYLDERGSKANLEEYYKSFYKDSDNWR